MSDLGIVSHLITLGCGIILGVIITLTVIMVRDMMKDKNDEEP